MIRLRVTGGEVTVFTSKFINIGTCPNDLKTDGERICVDVAKTDPFVQGEVVGTFNVIWAAGGTPHIYRSAEDGMYNGTDFHASN